MQEHEISQIVYHALDMMNANAVRTFQTPPETLIGPGAIARIGEAVKARGMGKVYVALDEIVANLGLAEGVRRSLHNHGIDFCESLHKPGEPQSDLIENEACRFVESGCDGVVAVGGGSVLDAAKAIAVLAANPGLVVADLMVPANIQKRRSVFIAVPTTAGTGSEATNVTVITDSKTQHKQVIVHPDLVPDLALIDACLMLRVPPFFTAATGIDALVHAIESYIAKQATPMTRALSYQAIRLIGEALPIAVGQGDNVEAREAMALASYMAGVAFSNAGLGLTHAMAHQIGPRYKLPHGEANAILLPSVMVFNELVCKKAFTDIGLALTGEILAAPAVIHAIQKLIVDIGLPVNLAVVGGREEDFVGFAELALKDTCITTNPRTASREQIIKVYQHALTRQLAV